MIDDRNWVEDRLRQIVISQKKIVYCNYVNSNIIIPRLIQVWE